jgi:hypothetical protein
MTTLRRIPLFLFALFMLACSGARPSPASVAVQSGSVQPGSYSGSYSSGGYESAPQYEPRPEQRAGLATQWGESRYSHVSMTRFVRANPSQPLALATLHYNDAQGSAVQAMREGAPSGYLGLVDPNGGGAIRVSLRDENGNPLPAYVAGDEAFVVGEAGRRYSIHVENQSPFRFEIVASVDGLDVITGSDAAITSRGYVVNPWGSLDIDGFRQSHDAVAAFRFGSVDRSYAAQMTGSARNVGVIGVALFAEQGAAYPLHLLAEAQLRANANPFPGNNGFAQPPPYRY